MSLFASAVVIAVAVWAVARRADVRLVLTLAGFALGALAGDIPAVLRTFLATLSREQFVLPLCSAMGFAHVLRFTGCDRHLVQWLTAPIRRVRGLLVPGTVLIGFLVNIPIVSQAGTVVTVGPVLLPLLRAAGVGPVTAGAALLLGISLGGELLNPGSPELQSVSQAVSEGQMRETPAAVIAGHVAPLLFVHLTTAALLFWWLSARADRRDVAVDWPTDSGVPAKEDLELFKINYFQALVPLLPIAFLVLAGPPLQWLRVPRDWLVGDDAPASLRADSRLIGLAMLLGSAVAGLTAGRKGAGAARAFFEGAGYSYTHVVAVIVAATTFGRGIEVVGLASRLAEATTQAPALLVPSAMALPFGFALVCGSGMAATQSLIPFFVGPARAQGLDPATLGALVSVVSAAGRTVSPVAAITLLCSSMTGTAPLALARRVTVPLIAGLALMLLVRRCLL